MNTLGELLSIVLAGLIIWLVCFTEIPLKAARNVEALLARAYIGDAQ